MTDESVIQWLMDSDPSIRWQVMNDLIDVSVEDIAAERRRVAVEGFGAKLLALQRSDGSWGGAAWNGELDSTMHVLVLLRELGLDPKCKEAQRALNQVRAFVTWRGWDLDGKWNGWDFKGNPFFIGEVEPCINGQVAASGAYFCQDVQVIIDRLLKEQLPDGGWNCEAVNGSTRSSFNTTICVLEALLEYELAGGRSIEVTETRLRGQEFLLDRHLFRRKSTGEIIVHDRKGSSSFTNFVFPTWWHFDVLRGLDYFRKACARPDERIDEAIQLVLSKQGKDGRWLLDFKYPGSVAIDLEEVEGQPSRWNTLRALRVLKWYSEQKK